jgi:hypothetical protein
MSQEARWRPGTFWMGADPRTVQLVASRYKGHRQTWGPNVVMLNWKHGSTSHDLENYLPTYIQFRSLKCVELNLQFPMKIISGEVPY